MVKTGLCKQPTTELRADARKGESLDSWTVSRSRKQKSWTASLKGACKEAGSEEDSQGKEASRIAVV